jgi:hypothetical protein
MTSDPTAQQRLLLTAIDGVSDDPVLRQRLLAGLTRVVTKLGQLHDETDHLFSLVLTPSPSTDQTDTTITLRDALTTLWRQIIVALRIDAFCDWLEHRRSRGHRS